jgi:anti-anti-sigma factor
VTALRRLDAPTDLRPGDHVCWTFADAADLTAAVLPYLDEGRRRDEHLLVLGPSRPLMLSAVAALPHGEQMLADGRLEVRAGTEAFGTGLLDPMRQVEAIRGEVTSALQRGRAGLRLAADASVLAGGTPVQRRQLHVYERHGDELMGSAAMTALCLYDASLGDGVLDPLAVLHPGQHVGRRDPLVHLSGRGPWLSLHGEVDVSSADGVLRALVDVACGAPGEVVLDLADLDFLDVCGARALATATHLLAEIGVQLRLVRARRLAGRCLELFDLADEEGVSA